MDAGMIEKHDFYIDGGWTAPLDGIPCDVIDPSTEDVCARISLGGAADVDRAVAAARAALPGWRARWSRSASSA
jgi:aldehyde dehydrogenase (NAD+)